MRSKIRVLDELTINQIAAGEVIENTSSVVKELIENALDAEAHEICVEITLGGRQLIRVTDNGIGMNRDDALLSLERHATSKLKKLDDLASIGTMGFRGEAIPSIASISKFKLRTRPNSEKEGILLFVDGGRLLTCEHGPSDSGTSVEVKDLFFNVPVRRKFQKSPATDQNEILKIVTAFTLAFPNLSFKFIADQKMLINAPANEQKTFLEQLEQRIRDVLGTDFFEALLPISHQAGDFTVTGFIGNLTNHRPNRSAQTLFINKRLVQSLSVSYAIRDGYGPALPSNRFPVFILHLTLPSEMVDVNVHPQKREVRFQAEENLKHFLLEAVEKSLQNRAYSSFEFPKTFSLPAEPLIKEKTFFASYSLPEKEHRVSISLKPVERQEVLFQPKTLSVPKSLLSLGHYLILESPPDGLMTKGLCIVDLRAAFSRIFYEKTVSSLENNQITKQALLIPITIDLSPEDSEILLQNLSLFEKIGFEIRQCAPRNFFIETIPDLFSTVYVEETVQEMIASLKEENLLENQQKKQAENIALSLAKAYGFIKNPSLQEGELLLRELLSCQNPYFSPAGQATFICLSLEEIAEFFKTK